MDDFILDVIENKIKEYSNDSQIGRFEMIITPDFIKLQNLYWDWYIVIHSNKHLVKIDTHSTTNRYKKVYNYIHLLYNITTMNIDSIYFYPKNIEQDVYMDLQIHHREKTIEDILN